MRLSLNLADSVPVSPLAILSNRLLLESLISAGYSKKSLILTNFVSVISFLIKFEKDLLSNLISELSLSSYIIGYSDIETPDSWKMSMSCSRCSIEFRPDAASSAYPFIFSTKVSSRSWSFRKRV